MEKINIYNEAMDLTYISSVSGILIKSQVKERLEGILLVAKIELSEINSDYKELIEHARKILNSMK